jgi:hypothetical protein
MEVQLDKNKYLYEQVTARIERTKEEDMHHSGIDFPIYIVITSKTPIRMDDSTSIRQITNDDGKSAIFQEMLFIETATRVLRRNRKLFEQLAKY